jgi:release factor glutamine methyltransferase
MGWADGLGRFDLILCNPPYVQTQAELAPQVRNHEPHSALYSGQDGLDDYRVLIPQIPALLVPSGIAIVELGKHQDQAVSNLAASWQLHAQPYKDLAGIVRALALSTAPVA